MEVIITPTYEHMSRVAAEQVAEVIWKAAHGRKVHWPVGLQFKVLRSVLQHAPYSVNRAIMRYLTGY